MAKAALHMFTKCIPAEQLVSDKGDAFAFHGCDPGWISVDEYYEETRPWIVPPLDEVDGASRILYPIFTGLETEVRTRKHYNAFLY
jgi:hypothetical protein